MAGLPGSGGLVSVGPPRGASGAKQRIERRGGKLRGDAFDVEPCESAQWD